MIFNTHSNLEGMHAFLSPSKAAWTKYDEDKLARVFTTAMAARRGTEMHDLACRLIRLGVKLPRTPSTINMYVNDAIGYRMSPEQPLRYSENCFGTADAIGFRNNILRIHDLKTGVTQSTVTQLEVYEALFCLEYDCNPFEIKVELRIYQNDEVREYEPDPDDIMHIMEKIKAFDKLIREWRSEVSL